MTYEEAIKNINALNAVCGQKDLYDAEFESALALAVDALKKQIPKKPLSRSRQKRPYTMLCTSRKMTSRRSLRCYGAKHEGAQGIIR